MILVLKNPMISENLIEYDFAASRDKRFFQINIPQFAQEGTYPFAIFAYDNSNMLLGELHADFDVKIVRDIGFYANQGINFLKKNLFYLIGALGIILLAIFGIVFWKKRNVAPEIDDIFLNRKH